MKYNFSLRFYLGTADWNAMSGVCLVTQVAKTQFFTRLTASGASSIYAAIKLGFWHVILGNWWQLTAIKSQKWWNCRGGEKGWENVKTWTRTVTGGVANQRVLVYPVNEARRQLYGKLQIQMIRCSFLQVKQSNHHGVISLTHTSANMILPITLWPNATSNISTGKSSLVCASCLHGILVKKHPLVCLRSNKSWDSGKLNHLRFFVCHPYMVMGKEVPEYEEALETRARARTCVSEER